MVYGNVRKTFADKASSACGKLHENTEDVRKRTGGCSK